MGLGKYDIPEKLPAKLLQIRLALGLTQSEMLEVLGKPQPLLQTNISRFERGVTQPPLRVLLGYARVAHVTTDDLIDDEIEFTEGIPVPVNNRKRE